MSLCVWKFCSCWACERWGRIKWGLNPECMTQSLVIILRTVGSLKYFELYSDMLRWVLSNTTVPAVQRMNGLEDWRWSDCFRKWVRLLRGNISGGLNQAGVPMRREKWTDLKSIEKIAFSNCFNVVSVKGKGWEGCSGFQAVADQDDISYLPGQIPRFVVDHRTYRSNVIRCSCCFEVRQHHG